ncbi:hypothetical protein HZU77_011500 [Neisseriaceae bacterium TC5R-5]|nr:hypothetical protein [Neisseriaceae bacterium TC5R-5]
MWVFQRRFLLAILCLGVFSFCGTFQAQAAESLPVWPCPAEIKIKARCYSGQDEQGAFYWLAVPQEWNQVLLLHAHGGPELGAPTRERSEQDLKRWAVLVNAGYAWAGSSYRRGGYGVTMAAEDTERLRQLVLGFMPPPRRTLLHGQSYGAGVAAKAVELYAHSAQGQPPYDGVLLSNGVLGGGGNAYPFRLDLRVVYQYFCQNHPRADEPAYPLWQGLPAGSRLSRSELAVRVDECTGLSSAPTQRSALQQQRLNDILNVVKIPERSLLGHLNWATWLFADLTQQRLDNKNPFTNEKVIYQGSSDDLALNAGVQRYRADPVAVAQLAADSQANGQLPVPVLSIHAMDDPTAFVELESVYRQQVSAAGQQQRLLQLFAAESEHSYLGDVYYPALLTALLNWIDTGSKPTAQQVMVLCVSVPEQKDKACRIRPDYQPAALTTRVAPR